MIEKESIENVQEALGIAIKEVGKLTDGKKDMYRFRKANPKIYKYILIGIFVEKCGMGLGHLVQAIETFKIFRED